MIDIICIDLVCGVWECIWDLVEFCCLLVCFLSVLKILKYKNIIKIMLFRNIVKEMNLGLVNSIVLFLFGDLKYIIGVFIIKEK